MIHFDKHHLSNGLTMLHHRDATTPFVVVNLLYKVGARNEDPERTGFAHLFEHLMFEGTERIPDFDTPVQEAGGSNNAFTNNDYTNYYIKLPRENVEMAMFLEADRMQHLAITPRTLRTQKKVVIEEFKENYTNKPYGDVWHLMREMVYEKHPYRWPTIGKDYNHIRKAGLEHVVEFYRKYYHPANCILCLAGNIEFEEAKTLTEYYFGMKHAAPRLKPQVFEEPAQQAARRKTVRRAVPLEAVYIVYKMPGRADPAYFAADVLSDILSGSKSSRLTERLVKQRKLFVSCDAYVTGTIDTGMFVLEGRLREGVSAKTAEKALLEELALLEATGPGRRELDKVKHKLITYMNFSENNLMNRAISLSFHELLGNAGDINKEEERYEAVGAKELQAFVREYLQPHQASTLYYLKKKE